MREIGMSRAAAYGARVEIYGRTARFLHWLTVILLAVQLPVGFYMTYRGGTLNLWDGLTDTLYSAHKLGGLLILLLVVWRLGYRVSRGAPADEPTLAGWQRLVAHLNHWGLYLLLIALPVVGYVGISRFPALDVFGLMTLPAIAAPDKEGAATAFMVHGYMAWALVVLIAMHVGAALHHYFIRKDNVLGRMLPSLLRR
jgi:cytochrome b561